MVVYADMLLAVNWWVDFLLLLAVRRFMGIGAKPWRLIIAALLGGLFSFVLLLPPMAAWLTVTYNVLAAWLTVGVAFGFRLPAVWRRCGVFFLLSTAVAGVAMAVYWLFAPRGLSVINGVVYCDLPPLLLVFLADTLPIF